MPDVCTNTPLQNKAFCDDHCKLLHSKAPHVPTGLREFLKHTGALENGLVAQCTGIASLIQEHPALASGTIDEDEEVTVCHKNIGQGSRLRKWSRGHQFVVRGGGHIDTWQPLYK